MLRSLVVQAPSWESLGGGRLVQTAVVAGASGLLIQLGDACREGNYGYLGPYCDAVGPEAVLHCMEQFAQYDLLAELVSPRARLAACNMPALRAACLLELPLHCQPSPLAPTCRRCRLRLP